MSKGNPAVQSGEETGKPILDALINASESFADKPETPGITAALAEINRRFSKAGERYERPQKRYECAFVPSSVYHICYQCGKTRDEHLAGKSTFTVAEAQS